MPHTSDHAGEDRTALTLALGRVHGPAEAWETMSREERALYGNDPAAYAAAVNKTIDQRR